MRRLALVALLAIIAAIAVAGALLTPLSPKAYAQNPYIIGGTLEVPKGAPPANTGLHISTTLLVVIATVAAIAVGAVVAYKLSK